MKVVLTVLLKTVQVMAIVLERVGSVMVGVMVQINLTVLI